MGFYRLAEEQDFILEIKYYEDYKIGVEKICSLVKEGKKILATKELRTIKGIGLKEAKQICDKYESSLKAFECFKSGKKIYTDY